MSAEENLTTDNPPRIGSIVTVKMPVDKNTFHCSGTTQNVPNGTRGRVVEVEHRRNNDCNYTAIIVDLIGEPGKDFNFIGLLREGSPAKNWALTPRECTW